MSHASCIACGPWGRILCKKLLLFELSRIWTEYESHPNLLYANSPHCTIGSMQNRDRPHKYWCERWESDPDMIPTQMNQAWPQPHTCRTLWTHVRFLRLITPPFPMIHQHHTVCTHMHFLCLITHPYAGALSSQEISTGFNTHRSYQY